MFVLNRGVAADSEVKLAIKRHPAPPRRQREQTDSQLSAPKQYDANTADCDQYQWNIVSDMLITLLVIRAETIKRQSSDLLHLISPL